MSSTKRKSMGEAEEKKVASADTTDANSGYKRLSSPEASGRDAGADKTDLRRARTEEDSDPPIVIAPYHDHSRDLKGASHHSSFAATQTFPMILHKMLSHPEFDHIITWLPHGRAWRILRHKEFEDKVIPLYFQHGRYASFARQVNAWGFRRITDGVDFKAYYHEKFLRGMPHLCEKMKRLENKELPSAKDAEPLQAPDFYVMSRQFPVPSMENSSPRKPGPGPGYHGIDALNPAMQASFLMNTLPQGAVHNQQCHRAGRIDMENMMHLSAANSEQQNEAFKRIGAHMGSASGMYAGLDCSRPGGMLGADLGKTAIGTRTLSGGSLAGHGAFQAGSSPQQQFNAAARFEQQRTDAMGRLLGQTDSILGGMPVDDASRLGYPGLAGGLGAPQGLDPFLQHRMAAGAPAWGRPSDQAHLVDSLLAQELAAGASGAFPRGGGALLEQQAFLRGQLPNASAMNPQAAELQMQREFLARQQLQQRNDADPMSDIGLLQLQQARFRFQQQVEPSSVQAYLQQLAAAKRGQPGAGDGVTLSNLSNLRLQQAASLQRSPSGTMEALRRQQSHQGQKNQGQGE